MGQLVVTGATATRTKTSAATGAVKQRGRLEQCDRCFVIAGHDGASNLRGNGDALLAPLEEARTAWRSAFEAGSPDEPRAFERFSRLRKTHEDQQRAATARTHAGCGGRLRLYDSRKAG